MARVRGVLRPLSRVTPPQPAVTVPVYPPIHPAVHLCTHPFVRLPISPSICAPTRLSVHLPIYPSVCPNAHTSICLCAHLSASLGDIHSAAEPTWGTGDAEAHQTGHS